MSTPDITALLQDAYTIRGADTPNSNTAERVGKMFVDIVEALEENADLVSSLTTLPTTVGTLSTSVASLTSRVEAVEELFTREADPAGGYRIRARYSLYTPGYLSSGGVGTSAGGTSGGVSGGALSLLSDVVAADEAVGRDTSTPAVEGDILQYDGSHWHAAPPDDSDKTYIHQQDVASSSWLIVHNMGKYPSVTVFDSSGRQFLGDVQYTDQNRLTVTFHADFSGKAILN